MIKILYIVSTLKKSGPTNQLFNIISNLDRNQFDPYLLTLSPEPKDSKLRDFEKLDVPISSLGLSRLSGFFFAKRELEKHINKLNPDLIHTQGLRADVLMTNIKIEIAWIMTARNYPTEDYPAKFGKIKGHLMAYQHFRAMKACKNVVSCSYAIKNKLADLGIKSIAIQNGVVIKDNEISSLEALRFESRPVWITVGSLIPRKNVSLIISAFNIYIENNPGALVILGDGFEMAMLKRLASNNSNIHFFGNVDKVSDYLRSADVFISSSLSEGLPNTVLEALANGLPCLLSDIDPHREIASKFKRACELYSLSDKAHDLASKMKEFYSFVDDNVRNEASEITKNTFSAAVMSNNYQFYYRKVLSTYV